MNIFRSALVAIFLTFLLAPVSEARPVKASKADKCPVCGMFVAKYPDFLAQVIFTDGTYALFDGVKDMFKYYFNIKKYDASRDLSGIAFIYVTDYYEMTPIDGRKAWYVLGSDVYGPMGRELIPFEKEADAKEFMKDHAGKRLISFDEVTPDLIKGLD
jgi:copper chaperone NosL